MANVDVDYMVLRRTWRHRVKMSLRGCRPKLSLRLCLFEEEFCLDLFGFLIAIPFLDRWHREPHDCMESWGVYYSDAAVVLCCGNLTKFIHMPWEYHHIKHEVMRPDGSWVPAVASYDEGKINKKTGLVMEPDGRLEEKHPYHYLLLPSGDVQHAIATIYVERREWRQKWLRWCPLFAKRRQSIDISFDQEMGSRAGSWKGGVLGTGYEMRPGEQPVETLKRMQREYRFDR